MLRHRCSVSVQVRMVQCKVNIATTGTVQHLAGGDCGAGANAQAQVAQRIAKLHIGSFQAASFCITMHWTLTAADPLQQLLWNVVLCRVATAELSPGPKRKLREEDAERCIDVEAQCSTQSVAMPTRR